MKHLIEYIKECGEGVSTPSNTLGIGNPVLPTDTEPGSEPYTGKVQKQKQKQKRKKKVVKESIFESTFEAIENINKLKGNDLEYAIECLYGCTGASKSNYKNYRKEIEKALQILAEKYTNDIMYYEGNNKNGRPIVLIVKDLKNVEYIWDFEHDDWNIVL